MFNYLRRSLFEYQIQRGYNHHHTHVPNKLYTKKFYIRQNNTKKTTGQPQSHAFRHFVVFEFVFYFESISVFNRTTNPVVSSCRPDGNLSLFLINLEKKFGNKLIKTGCFLRIQKLLHFTVVVDT